MPDPAINQDMILGEMRGQLRELVHSTNNLSQKFDGLTREVIGLGPLATTVSGLESRVAALEAAHQREAGAHGVVGAVLKSPVVAWLAAAGAAFWAFVVEGPKP